MNTPALLAMTDDGGLTHLVTDEAMAAGRRYGRHTAVCTAHVLAASLTMPESGRCQICRRWRAGLCESARGAAVQAAPGA